MTNLSKLADELKPYFVPWVRKIAQGNGGSAAGSGGSPDMVAHVLADTSALGTFHTVSGLTAGQVLVATAATAAHFGTLSHTYLSDLTSGNPHTQYPLTSLTLTAGDGLTGGGTLAANRTFTMGTPSALTVSTTSAVTTTSHTHAITASSSPGAAAALLKTDASGFLTLQKLTTPTLSAVGVLSIEPAGSIDLDSATNLIRVMPSNFLKSDHYASQTTGWGIDYAGNADFRYLYAGELHAKSFIADLEQALAGGQIISKSVAVLAHDFTNPAAGTGAYLYVEDLPSAPDMAVFVSGDTVRLRVFSRAAGELVIADTWGVVGSVDGDTGPGGYESGTQRYTFMRSSGANSGSLGPGETVPAKSLALDYGTTGNGFYEVNSIDGAYAINSPYSQVVSWATHPATGQTVRVRMGNLRGITGSTEYGFWAGETTLGNVLVTGGKVAMRQGTTEVITLAADGTSYFAGAMGLGASGGIYQGSGTFASPTTGLKLWNASGVGRLAGYLSGVEQAGFDSSGRITAGGTRVTLDAAGIALEPNYTSATITVTNVGRIFGLYDAGSGGNLYIDAGYSQPKTSLIQLNSYSGTTLMAGVELNPATPKVQITGGLVALSTLSVAGVATLGASLGTTTGTALELKQDGMSVLYAVKTGADNFLNLGSGRSADGTATIRLIGDTTYTGYGAALQRGSGANGATQFLHRGTGNLDFVAVDAAAFTIKTSNTSRMTVGSTGLVGIGVTPATQKLKVLGSVAVGGDDGGTASYTTITNVTSGKSTGVGTIRLAGSSARDSTGFVKAYVGTTAIWLPYWDNIGT